MPRCRSPPPRPSLPPAHSPPRGTGGTSPSLGILLLSPLHLCPKVKAAGSDYFSHMRSFPGCKRCSQQGFQFSKPEPCNPLGAGTGTDPAAGGTAGARRGWEGVAAQGTLWGPPPGLRSAAASSLHRFALAACWGTETPFTALPAAVGPRSSSLAGPQGSSPRANEGSSLWLGSWEGARGQATGQGLSPRWGVSAAPCPGTVIFWGARAPRAQHRPPTPVPQMGKRSWRGFGLLSQSTPAGKQLPRLALADSAEI